MKSEYSLFKVHYILCSQIESVYHILPVAECFKNSYHRAKFSTTLIYRNHGMVGMEEDKSAPQKMTDVMVLPHSDH